MWIKPKLGKPGISIGVDCPAREQRMMPKLKRLILSLLNEHRVMTIATNRPDGWPQATMVGYVNDGFLLYCFVASNAQKYANILHDPRVSLAIGSDAAHPLDIKGLSLAGRAAAVESSNREVTSPAERKAASDARYATRKSPSARTGPAAVKTDSLSGAAVRGSSAHGVDPVAVAGLLPRPRWQPRR